MERFIVSLRYLGNPKSSMVGSQNPRHQFQQQSSEQRHTKTANAIPKEECGKINATFSATPIRHTLSGDTIIPRSDSISKIPHPTENEPSRFSLWITVWVTDWWGMEILGWIIAAFSLILMIVVLESYKNKPVPTWPLGITINSLVSTLATTGQMAMMNPVVECISQLKWLWFVRKEHRLSEFQAFDDASRGPTGSLLLIGKLRGLHLVCIGAVITVLSIAFGPCTQQVVVYSQRLHPIGNSTTPQVLTYTGAGDIGGIPSPEILSAILQGFGKDVQDLSTVTPLCTTGNCTWNPYPSLGVCSGITEISSSLIQSPCNQTVLDGYIRDTTKAENPGYQCFNWTYPAQHIVSETWMSATVSENVSLSNANSGNIILDDGSQGINVNTMSIIAATENMADSTFMTAYLLYQPGFYTSTNTSLPDPVAYKLTLDFCLQNLSTSVQDGKTTTVVESSQPLSTALFQTGLSDDSGYNISESQGTFSEGHSFGFSQEGVKLLRPALWAVFEDSCLQLLNLSDMPNFSCGLSSGSSFLDPLFISPNATSAERYSVVAAIMDNIAVSLTNVFRVGVGNDTQVIDFQGTASTPVAYLETAYVWLILPIALVSLTLVFLLATILTSDRLGSRVWKSSTFATLQGLASELHDDLRELSSISEMEEKAKNIKVRFNEKAGAGVENGLMGVKENKCFEVKEEKYFGVTEEKYWMV